MNLNPNYNYLIIDTETTGLSIEDDQIIQVALITIDHQWNITNRYTHYVKPTDFGDDQLKPLIQHITGIDPTQIMSAPPLSTIWGQIEQYWDDRTVVIGHNISFDLAMLGKHHKLEYADTIDTFDCAKTLVHYQRSYSLEILHQQLLLQPRYQAYLKGITIKPHDALSDCYMTYGLLRYCMERVGDMTDEYSGLDSVLEDGQWSKYVISNKLHGIGDKNLGPITSNLGPVSLPTLKSPVATPKTMVDHEYYDWTGLASTSKIGLEDAGFAASLLKLVHPSRKMIIAFAHRAKLDLAKKILADHGIVGIGYMRANQYIDPIQLTNLGSQGQRDHDEVSRILKYCSHHMQGLSVLDHNTPGDFKVYQRVRLIRDDGDADIILSTHAGVYAALQEGTHSDHAILFWDHQWWLSSAQRFYQSGVRIDHVINMIEGIIYKLKHQDTSIDSTKLDELQNRREITRGIFGSELLAYRSQLPTNNKGNIECLGGLPREHMTNFTLLYTQKDQYFSIISDFLALDHSVSITRILDRLDMLLHDGCQIDIQSNYQGDNITISPANTYVDYADFRALFAGRHVIFANTSGQGTDNITTPLRPHPPTIQLSHLRELNYQVGQKLYIIQSNRNQCRATFDTLMKQGLNKQTLLMGENVTGGGNKLIEQARGASSYVMVGGYDLYMQTLAAGLVFDAVMTVGTLGALHDQMVRDVEFYAS